MNDTQWKASLSTGKRCIQEKRYEEALSHLTQSIKSCAQIDAYEMRSLAYTTLGKHKEALLDSKRAINMDPKRWQSYARSASIFLQTKRWDAAISMANLALARIGNDGQKKVRLTSIRVAAEEGKRLDALDRRKNFCHIAALPVELLSTIFLDVVDSDLQNLKTVSVTCRHWHAVAIETPKLWATLTVTEKRPLSRAQVWLSRSKDKLRSLDIQGKAISIASDHKLLTWNGLHRLQLDKYSLPLFCMMCHKHGIPPLEQMQDVTIDLPEDIRPLGSFNHDTRLFLISFIASKNHDPLIGQFPSLCNLIIRHIEIPWHSVATYTTLVTLEIATFSGIPDGEAHLLKALLENNTNLETLKLSFKNSHRSLLQSQPTSSPLELPHLKCLHLTCFPVRLEWLFDAYSLPALEHLSLVSCQWLDTISFSNGSRKLKSLAMRYMPLPDPTNILSQSAQIEEFALTGKETDSLVDWLSRSDNPCKSLCTLNISKTDVRTGTLVRLVKSRLGTDGEEVDDRTPISSLIIDECPNVDAQWLPWLREHVKEVSCVYMTRKQARARR